MMKGGCGQTNQLMSLQLTITTVCMCVGSCLATKFFIGNLLATGRGWIIMK